MEIDPLLFEDNESFREMLPGLKKAGLFKPDQDHEVWGVRAYCLSEEGHARNPVALWLSRMQNRDYRFIQEKHWRQGNIDFGGELAEGGYTRDVVIEELKKHIGRFLPGGHEIIGAGIDHAEDGVLSWEKIPEEALQMFARAVKSNEQVPPPSRMTLGEFLLSELGPDATNWTDAKILKEIEAKSRRENWDSILCERAPQLQGRLQEMDRQIKAGTWPKLRPEPRSEKKRKAPTARPF